MGLEMLERIFGADRMHDLQALAFEHALGGHGDDAAVLDVEHARARRRVRAARSRG
jgi:hypothetical protein